MVPTIGFAATAGWVPDGKQESLVFYFKPVKLGEGYFTPMKTTEASSNAMDILEEPSPQKNMSCLPLTMQPQTPKLADEFTLSAPNFPSLLTQRTDNWGSCNKV